MAQAHAFVVAVADADGKPATLHAGVEVEDAEHLHAVLGNGKLVLDDVNVPEAESFNQGLNDFAVRYRPVCGCAHWCGNERELLTSQLFS